MLATSTHRNPSRVPMLPTKLPEDPGAALIVKQIWTMMREHVEHHPDGLTPQTQEQAIASGKRVLAEMERYAASDPHYAGDVAAARPAIEGAFAEFGAIAYLS